MESNEKQKWEVGFDNRSQRFERVSVVVLIEIVERLLDDLSGEAIPASVCELSIVFVDDPEMRELNSEYRGRDYPTDVLSFSQLEGEAGGIEPRLLGDIVISLETIDRQAVEHQVTFDEELLRMLIHGMLHLFGYDHENVPDEEAKRMQEREEELYSRYITALTS